MKNICKAIYCCTLPWLQEIKSSNSTSENLEPVNLSKCSRSSSSASDSSENPEGFNVLHDPHATVQSQTSVHQRRQRMHSNFDDLSKVYFDSRTSLMADKYDGK